MVCLISFSSSAFLSFTSLTTNITLSYLGDIRPKSFVEFSPPSDVKSSGTRPRSKFSTAWRPVCTTSMSFRSSLVKFPSTVQPTDKIVRTKLPKETDVSEILSTLRLEMDSFRLRTCKTTLLLMSVLNTIMVRPKWLTLVTPRQSTRFAGLSSEITNSVTTATFNRLSILPQGTVSSHKESSAKCSLEMISFWSTEMGEQ